MKTFPDRRSWTMLLLAFCLAVIAPSLTLAQGSPDVSQGRPEAQGPPGGVPQDPIARLNLSPEQRQQIRSIREQNKDERETINRRLRETTIALEKALDADTPDEATIELRVREAGEAQTALIRLRALTETRIRRVLTPEQINTLRVIRAQSRREERQDNRAQDGQPRRPPPNQRNGMTSDPNIRRNGLPRRPLQ